MLTLARQCMQHAEALRLFINANEFDEPERLRFAREAQAHAETLRPVLERIGYGLITRPASLKRERHVVTFIRRGADGHSAIVFDKFNSLDELKYHHPRAVRARDLRTDGSYTIKALIKGMNDAERLFVRQVEATARDQARLDIFGSKSADACGDGRVELAGDTAARRAIARIVGVRNGYHGRVEWNEEASHSGQPGGASTQRRSVHIGND